MYTDQATGFVLAILILSGALGFVIITSAYFDSKRANAWISTAAFLNLVNRTPPLSLFKSSANICVAQISSALGAGFIYSIANIVDVGKLDIGVDTGQSVQLGVPTPLLAMMPIAELLLMQGKSLNWIEGVLYISYPVAHLQVYTLSSRKVFD